MSHIYLLYIVKTSTGFLSDCTALQCCHTVYVYVICYRTKVKKIKQEEVKGWWRIRVHVDRGRGTTCSTVKNINTLACTTH